MTDSRESTLKPTRFPNRVRRVPRPMTSAAVAGLVVLSLLALTPVGAGSSLDVSSENPEYDGGFTFVRLSYEMSLRGGSFLGGRDLPWAHDYPRAERNLTKILDEVTSLNLLQGAGAGNGLAS